MPDMPHIHEVEIGEGVTVTTGPPFPIEPETEPPPTDGMELRDEGEPVKRTKHIRKSSTDLAEIEAREAQQVEAAGDDPDRLPEHAKSIWYRMFQSGKRYSDDATYAAMVAWRAVRKRYGIERGGKRQESAPVPRPALQTKTAAAGTILREDTGVYVVRITDEKPDAYKRVERVALDMVPGVAATVGTTSGGLRNITSVIVPKRLAVDQKAAITWVRRHWDWIWKHATGHMGAMRVVDAKRHAAQGVRQVSGRLAHRRYELKRFHGGKHADGGPVFVSDPRHATKRIAYGEVYPPYWVDHQGEYATEEQVEEMAHKFMKARGVPGLMHAAWPVGEIVESFVARRGDPDFTPGAWVAATEYPPDVWTKIASGELTGYSMGGAWDGEYITRAT